ncbi:aldo/keto reductase [Pediococcus siamensis]|uniref:aldo/keto reductase n=1 Tax=Pediococcus siamensis TaxID=381829 RepID=UPI0039A02B56
MQYTKLGNTGMKVSRLCLGTMNFGAQTDEKEAFAIMDRALEAGINFFDTANVYGGNGHNGRTEEIIGDWFAQGNERREQVILGTKVYMNMHNPLDGPNGPDGISAYKIYRELNRSLKRLNTDHVELYQIHHIVPNINWDEIFGALENVIAQGKVYYVGSSNFSARDLVFAAGAAKERHFLGFVNEQTKYSLNCRLPELELLPAAQKLGMGVTVWGPLDGGMLAGNVIGAKTGRRAIIADSLTEYQKKQLADYSALCKEIDEKEADVALAWVLQNPAITAPTIGPRTVDQLNDLLHITEIDLTPDIMDRLNEIFPGPGGAAPQAYAW